MLAQATHPDRKQHRRPSSGRQDQDHQRQYRQLKPLSPDLSPEAKLSRSLSRLRHGQHARRHHEASDERPRGTSNRRHSSRPKTGSGEEGSTLWERRGAGALREVVTSQQPQSPARGQSSGPPSLSSVPGNGTARDVPALPSWFGGDFVADVVQSIHSPPSSHGSPTALERLERLEADALDVAARSPSPMHSTMPRPLRQQHWPTAPAQPVPARTGVVGETLTGLRRASLQLGAEAAAEVAAREHAMVGRRAASVAVVKVGVLREYDAAKVARERYDKAAPAREALTRQSSPEHDKARRLRTAERARVAAERAAREQAERAEASRKQALVDEREAGLQAAIDKAAGGADRAAIDKAERAQARWARAVKSSQFQGMQYHTKLMERSVNSVGAAALRIARAAEEVAERAEEEWAGVLGAEEAEDDDAIHFEPREPSGDEEAEEEFGRAFGTGPSPRDGPKVGLGALGKKVQTSICLSPTKGSRVKLQEPEAGPSAGKAGSSGRRELTRDGRRVGDDELKGFAQAAPTALELLSVPEEKKGQQADEGWYQWAKLPGVAAGARQGTAADEEDGDGSERSNIDLGYHRAIDPLLAPALRTAKRRVAIGRDSRKQALNESVVALAIEKYGDPDPERGHTWIGGPGVDWGIYTDQVFGWGLMGQHDEIVEPKAYGEFAIETMDEFALDLASDTFAATALAGTNLPAVEDLFARVRSRKPPGGVSKGGALQELYELEALSEAKAHKLYDHVDNTPVPEILRVRPQSEGLF
jgi:hypothetical protein